MGKDHCYPAMKHWPGIIEFLRYDPTPESRTIGDRLLAYSSGSSRAVADREVDDALRHGRGAYPKNYKADQKQGASAVAEESVGARAEDVKHGRGQSGRLQLSPLVDCSK